MAVEPSVIRTHLEAARKELLDLGLRNPMLNYRTLRSRGVEVVGASSASVYQSLVRERKAMWFMPQPSTEASSSAINSNGASRSQTTARQNNLALQTAVQADPLHTRLLNTYYAARTHVEERGANILYLALGMLHWYEAPQSQQPRQAPLLLVPVQLERATVDSRFQITYSDEDIEGNLSLVAKLQREFGLTLPDLPDPDDLNVTVYFDEIQHAIQLEPRWHVEYDSVALGFFSFGKFMMYHDLDEDTWPDEARPTGHPILQALLGDGFRDPPSPYGDDDNVDELLTPADSPQVVDADSSQTLALLSVKGGRNLVIQGPPGTGKSQTITNLIADAIDRGQTVLFVAEKMAALDVVKRRLDSIGLGSACLELHSQKAHKSAVIRDLASTLALGRPRLDDRSAHLATLGALQNRLNAYSEAMNTPVAETGLTPHQALGALLRIRAQYPGVVLPRLPTLPRGAWTAIEYSRREALVEQLQSCLAAVSVSSDHPFWTTRRTSLSPIEHGRLQDTITNAISATVTLSQLAARLSGILGIVAVPRTRAETEALLAAAQRVMAAPDLEGINLRRDLWQRHESELRDVLAARARLADLHSAYDGALRPAAWSEDVATAREDYHAYQARWWRVFSGRYRQARGQIAALYEAAPPSNSAQFPAAADAVIEAQHQQAIAQRLDPVGVELLGPHWHDGADWTVLIGASEWVVEMFRDIGRNLLPAEVATAVANREHTNKLADVTADLSARLVNHREALLSAVEEMGLLEQQIQGGDPIDSQSFEAQEKMLATWMSSVDILQAIIAAQGAMVQCRKEGLGDVADLAATWTDASTHLLAAWRRAWFEGIADRAYAERSALSAFDGSQHSQAIDTFRGLDSSLFDYNRARLSHRHWEELPRHEAGGELGVLRREFEKKTRHLPIRKLMQRAGHAIQAIKPVFMMSPLSVATFLPQGSLTFDLIIFDEASQVKPVDALGAIVRGHQVVVVGDNKQLPPTSFFDVMLTAEDTDEDDKSVTEDIESILGLFAAQGASERMLRWHYRSRHESLIAVSNSEFYNHRLIVFPSPDAGREHLGLVFHHLPHTAYDRGRTRTNMKEAEAVARAVMTHARAMPHLTLGVAAFSVAQMQAIQDQLELLRRSDQSCEEFFANHSAEPFFVKNLETVQGDERDVIFISIGYGRTTEGYVAMDFGPLNRAGGERRLNVLITRARLRCEVFTNLTADDVDLGRTRARGVSALKTFLTYAQHGRLDVPVVSGRPMDSPFEEAVADALVAQGYTVEAQVGSAGFFIDLAIVDPARPGRYLLGIECDGATYHSARSARDRDRLRQQVLEGLGWRLHRIWSTDWFRNPDRELQRVIEAIDKAINAEVPNTAAVQRLESPIEAMIEREALSFLTSNVSATVPYHCAQLRITLGGMGLHEVSRLRIADWIGQVVAVESPVHEAEVARRIADAAGVKRIGNRIEETFQLSINLAVRQGLIHRHGEFLWAPGMSSPVLRSRSNLPAASRKLEYVAPEEIALAVEAVVDGAYGIENDDIPPAVGQALGFGRVSDDMRSKIDTIIRQMLMDGRLTLQGAYVMKRKDPA